MNSPKTRQHKFVEKFPVVAAILMAIFWMFLFELIEGVINLGIHMVISGYDAATGPVGLFAGTANQRVRCRNRAGRTLCRNCDYADFV